MVSALLVGFDVIPQSAEEIDLPPNKIGRLLVISVACAVAWYVLIAFAVGLGLTAEQQASSTMATADAAKALWRQPWAGALLVLGGIGGIMFGCWRPINHIRRPAAGGPLALGGRFVGQVGGRQPIMFGGWRALGGRSSVCEQVGGWFDDRQSSVSAVANHVWRPAAGHWWIIQSI